MYNFFTSDELAHTVLFLTMVQLQGTFVTVEISYKHVYSLFSRGMNKKYHVTAIANVHARIAGNKVMF